MVGAGKLIQLLFGLDYWIAVVLVGGLMMIYVTFGGMKATTWVQIIKAVLLLMGATFMAGAVLYRYGFSPEALFAKAVEVHPKKLAIMEPGSLISNPLSAVSLGLALMFGTAGLPHILMRFFTVKNAEAARKSVFVATGFIGYFYILTFIIGFGAIVLVSTDPAFLDAGILEKTKSGIAAIKGGSNMAAIHLANAVGGNVFLGFISAVAFATILAVVSGLALAGASSISHDITPWSSRMERPTSRTKSASQRSRRCSWAYWRSFWASYSKTRTSHSWSGLLSPSPPHATSRCS